MGREQRDGQADGAETVRNALGLQASPIARTSAAFQSGMAFMELPCVTSEAEASDRVKDDAVLFALQLKPCPDAEESLEDQRLRALGFRPGLLAMFDLNAGLCTFAQDPFHAVAFYLPRAAIDGVAEEVGSPPIAQFAFPPGELAEDVVARGLMMAMLPTLSRPPEERSHLFVDHIAMAMAIHVTHHYGNVAIRNPRVRGGLAPWQERRVKDLLSANLNGGIRLDELAMACDLSVRHFTRAFKASTGLTALEWLTMRRLEKAKELLEESSMSIPDIAFDCGFADTSHFGRTFNRHVGTTPGVWRRFNRR